MRKRSFRGKILLIVLLVGGFSVLSLDHLACHYDVASCTSDNLYVISQELYRYGREHDGAGPPTMKDFVTYLKSRHRYHEKLLFCQKTNNRYLWKADDDKPGKDPIVVMCPSGSHGWLRKYAWGIRKKGDTFYFVKARPCGQVTPGNAIRDEASS
jgi:hypothetical protein